MKERTEGIFEYRYLFVGILSCYEDPFVKLLHYLLTNVAH